MDTANELSQFLTSRRAKVTPGYEVMELPADRGLRLAVFTAEPGSRAAEALDLLASWAATPDTIDRSHQRR